MDADLIAAALAAAGDTTRLLAQAPVGGGSISRALRLETGQGFYLLKTGVRGLPGFYHAEARGLELLRSTGAVRVPLVRACRDKEDGAPGFILLEWLAAPPDARRETAAEALGVGLAALHRNRADAYGLDHDNYIGATPQPNGWSASWLAFFRERRLGFQIARAASAGLLDQGRQRALGLLLDRLGNWIDERLVLPALLHGDLWSGNMIAGPGGAPALIDPAVSYGDREADLAFTALFGGFPERFYHAYQEAWPLEPGWQERRDLYNLYHLLNHLNLFGPGYLPPIDAVVRKYS